MPNEKIESLLERLSWNEDPARQSEAVALLVAAGDRLDLTLILQTGDKTCWQNEARVLLALGYPGFREVIPGMLEWLQDLNWPGCEEIVEALAKVPTKELGPHLSKAVESALANDADWLFGLRYFAGAIGLTRAMVADDRTGAVLFDPEPEEFVCSDGFTEFAGAVMQAFQIDVCDRNGRTIAVAVIDQVEGESYWGSVIRADIPQDVRDVLDEMEAACEDGHLPLLDPMFEKLNALELQAVGIPGKATAVRLSYFWLGPDGDLVLRLV